MRRHTILAAITIAAGTGALAACAEPPAPPPAKSDTVSYKLRDHTGTTADHTAPRTEPQVIYYTKDQVHPAGVSDPVADRAAAVVFGITPLGLGADPNTFPAGK